VKEPNLVRPFKIPGGTFALAVLIMPPICLIAFMMSISFGDHSVTLLGRDRFYLLGLELGWYGVAGLFALLSGPLLYPVFRHSAADKDRALLSSSTLRDK